jgi:metal-responsive CopG/Arc/MetJ family transcriptional regulator
METAMATVNFSVPDDVKTAFDRTFRGQNKSAVIADLMRRAVADSERQKQREELFRLLTERRSKRPTANNSAIRAARLAHRS